MQSESVEHRILLSWSDELTIYTLLPLHHAFHVAHTWPNSKYEDINVSGAVEQVNREHRARRTCKTRPTRVVWGHAPPGKFSNLHTLRLNLEPSGGI